jgi:hypothetical protein
MVLPSAIGQARRRTASSSLSTTHFLEQDESRLDDEQLMRQRRPQPLGNQSLQGFIRWSRRLPSTQKARIHRAA